MASRLQLHEELVGVLNDPDAVYFQPPASMYMTYPCIKYKKVGRLIEKADNGIFRKLDRYQITLITDDPDDESLSEAMFEHFGARLGFEQKYTADDLYHEVYSLVY